MLSRPLRDRFGIPLQLSFYKPNDIEIILREVALNLKVLIDKNRQPDVILKKIKN